MTNRLKSALHKTAIATGILAGLILTNKESLAQTIASNGKNTHKTEINAANSLINKDPLAFIQQNIVKYFGTNSEDITKLKTEGYSVQDLQNHIDLINKKIGNGMIKDHVNNIIRQYIVANVPDTRSQIEGIMNLLESDIFGDDMSFKKIFGDVFMFEEKNYYIFELVSDGGVAHRKRLNENIDQMIKDIEQGKKDIEQGKKDIEQGKKDIEQGKKDIEQGKKDIEQGKKELEQNRIKMENQMIFITPDMVKSDPKVKKLIISWKQRYINLQQKPTNSHIILLFNALDQ